MSFDYLVPRPYKILVAEVKNNLKIVKSMQVYFLYHRDTFGSIECIK